VKRNWPIDRKGNAAEFLVYPVANRIRIGVVPSIFSRGEGAAAIGCLSDQINDDTEHCSITVEAK
jgi:basic membrane lipoprotein Med (substrate-binding protein (PBP1-ABC) superfamily)